MNHTTNCLNTADLSLAVWMARLSYWRFNLEQRTLEFSDDLYGILNVEKANKPFSLSEIKKRIHPDDWDIYIRSLINTVKNGSIFKLIIRILMPSQNPIILELKGQKINNTTNNHQEIFGIARDITEEHKLKNELNDALIEANNANKAKSMFLATMSHEIRTPLNAILGYTELLERTELNTVQNEYINTVKKTGFILLDIINDILDMSKVEAGKMNIESTSVHIRQFILELRQIVEQSAIKKQIIIDFILANNIEEYMIFDPMRLRQVLLNLLNNAIKFTEKGRVTLKVSKLKEQQDYHLLLFEVIDTGIGIKPEHLSKVFEQFEQADSSITRAYGGTGLGLNIANGILRLMNSELKVKSTASVGSTFYFEIPMKTVFSNSVKKDNVLDIILYIGSDNVFYNKLKSLENVFEVNINKSNYLTKNNTNNKFENILYVIDDKISDFNDTNIFSVYKYLNTNKNVNFLVYNEILFPKKKINSKNILFSEKHNDLSEFIDFIKNSKFMLKNKKNELSTDSKKMIFIVDDNIIHMDLIVSILKLNNVNVDIYKLNNGKEALNLFKEFIIKPDLIIMDIEMPIMDGYETLKAIRSLKGGNDIPIIALSARVYKDEQIKAIRLGFNEFISKPFNLDILLESIRFHLFNIDSNKKLILNENYAQRASNVYSSISYNDLSIYDKKYIVDILGENSIYYENLVYKTHYFLIKCKELLRVNNFNGSYEKITYDLLIVCRIMRFERLEKYIELNCFNKINIKNNNQIISNINSMIDDIIEHIK